jgi:hypothetical protein
VHQTSRWKNRLSHVQFSSWVRLRLAGVDMAGQNSKQLLGISFRLECLQFTCCSSRYYIFTFWYDMQHPTRLLSPKVRISNIHDFFFIWYSFSLVQLSLGPVANAISCSIFVMGILYGLLVSGALDSFKLHNILFHVFSRFCRSPRRKRARQTFPSGGDTKRIWLIFPYRGTFLEYFSIC